MDIDWELTDAHLDDPDLETKFDFYTTELERPDVDMLTSTGDGETRSGPLYVDDTDVGRIVTSASRPAEFPPDIESTRPQPRIRRTYEEALEIYPGRRSVWHVPRPALFENATDREFYMVYFPIDVYPPGPRRSYRRIEFGIELDGGLDVDSIDLCPQDVYGVETVSRTYRLEPTLKFGEIEAGIGHAGWQVSYQRLRPTVTPFGAGKPKFGWVYLPEAGGSIHPGSRHNFVLLNVPAGLDRVRGDYYSDVRYEQREYGLWWDKIAKADREIELELDDADTISDRWWDRATAEP